MYEFKLIVQTPTGTPVAETFQFLDLACSVQVNSYGYLLTRVPRTWEGIASLVTNSRLRVLWRDPVIGMPWTSLFVGLYRQREDMLDERDSVNLGAYGLNWLLSTRINAYPANLSGRTAFINQKAEDIMRTLVQYNITASATTANGRIRAGTNWPASVMSLAGGGGRGNTIPSWFNAHSNVLEDLQKLASIGGGDFDVYVASDSTYRFIFYPGQLGTDKTADVVFSLENGNMAAPVKIYDRTAEANVAIVGGQGEGSDRDFVSRTGSSHSTDNEIEMFVNATDVEPGDLSGLEARGDQKLTETLPIDEFSFEVLQTPGSRFGLHYSLGDLVSAVDPETGVRSTHKVSRADVSFDSDGRPKVEVSLTPL